MKIDLFISKENNVFYLDLGDYNQSFPDLKCEEGDTVKFTYDGIKYVGKIVNRGGAKNGIYQIEVKSV